jgi:Protein of unknown function (DUF2950)
MKTIATLTMLLCCCPALARAADEAQRHYATPEDAVRALEAAVRSPDAAKLLPPVLGPDSDEIVSSGDAVGDAATRKRFTTAASQGRHIELTDDRKTAILHVGHDDWPFPIPIVHEAAGWRFDTAEGKQELLNRRIGRNELTVITVCRTYVDAQNEFAKRFHEYAQSLRSSPGKQDGLYWDDTGRDPSPFGPLVASATGEGYRVRDVDEPPSPYHGYFFRILKAQGKDGPGGAGDYVKDGRMTGGFALIAWPADYGSSGVMTFLVGEQGVVFQKDLGAGTAEAAKAITTYDPDRTWEPTR